ncbi:MAG: SDR family oxidoreductase [Anaerolineae bacterium]|nr:SDR family oxidoreductase [Anaerolineae bacterium]
MIDPQLRNKVALVTGANMGIGAATAQALAAVGTAVFITYLGSPNDAKAAAVVSNIHRQGGQAASFAADLAQPAVIPTIFDEVEAAFGPVDILVNNAAYSVNDQIETLDTETFDRHYAVNVRAMALACQEFTRRRGERLGGRIINISSGVVEGAPTELAYSASKGAVEVLTRGLAKALAPKQILVNAVSPGPTDTGWLTPDLRAELARRTPLQRIGQPDDIANVIVFLASAQAGWLTGQILDAGGGWHMRF